jgi:hypothetical protein
MREANERGGGRARRARQRILIRSARAGSGSAGGSSVSSRIIESNMT